MICAKINLKNKMKKVFFYKLCILGIFASFAGSMMILYFPVHAGDVLEKNPSSTFIPGDVLIKFKSSEEIFKIKVDPNIDARIIAAEYRLRVDIEWAEPNYTVSAMAFPNDLDFAKQWYLETVRAKDAWSQELLVKESRQFNRESIIAILDTGVYLNHPDLKDNIWFNPGETPSDRVDNDKNGFIDDINGWDFLGDTNDPNPRFEAGYVKDAVNHGTIVAGIAAARGNNNIGITGVSWKSKIMPLRVLNSSGEGDIYDVYRAINYAIKNKANIINMSFVGVDDSTLLRDIIKQAYDAGILVVVAAGNTDPDQTGKDFQKVKMFPICSDSGSDTNFVIGVASMGKNNHRSLFSNYGDNCVDISAPGEEFYGTSMYNSSLSDFATYYGGYWSGTSLSAPLVSGALAMIKSVRPDLNNKQLVEALIKGADKAAGEGLGAGKLNIYNSLAYALAYKVGEPEARKEKTNLLVSALGFESFPQIKIFKNDDTIFKSFFSYSPTFKGSINIAVGDVDGDSIDEVVTGAGYGGGPHVRILDIDGHVKSQFFAFEKLSRSGVNIALGDIDGDKKYEIIAGAGKKSKPLVKIFSSDGKLIGSFMAYAENFLGGVNVASGDINGDGKDEIITGPGQGGGPHIRIFDFKGGLIGQFFAFNRDSRSGAMVSVGDMNNDIYDEIVATPAGNASPLVRIFRPTNYGIISEFFAFDPGFFYGVYTTVGDVDNDGENEIVAGAGIGGNAFIRIFKWDGTFKKQILAQPDFYKGGVRVSVMKYGL